MTDIFRPKKADPGNSLSLSLERLAQIAATREFAGATFEDIADPNRARIEGVDEAYSKALRQEIQRQRWLIEPEKTCPQAAAFLEERKHDLPEWRSTYAVTGVRQSSNKPKEDDADLPDVGRLFTAFYPHELLALASNAQKPKLTLVPDYGENGLNFTALIRAMNTYQRGMHRGPVQVSKHFALEPETSLVDHEKKYWKSLQDYLVYLVDAASQMQPYSGDQTEEALEARVQAHLKRTKEMGLPGLSRLPYAAIMLYYMSLEMQFDSQNQQTALEGDSARTSSLVPIVQSINDPVANGWQPNFSCTSLTRPFKSARFRLVAGGRRCN